MIGGKREGAGAPDGALFTIYDLRFTIYDLRFTIYEVNHNLTLGRNFIRATFECIAPLMGWLSASPDPSDQGESFSLSPLDPSLRGEL